MPDKPTVQDELLAACRTFMSCIEEHSQAQQTTVLADRSQRRKAAWDGLDAACYQGKRAIKRAEREVAGE